MHAATAASVLTNQGCVQHVTTSSVVFYLALLDKDKQELATVFGVRTGL